MIKLLRGFISGLVQYKCNMNKELKDWSILEVKAGIFDRQNEITILQNELKKRAQAPVLPVAEKVAEKVVEKK